MRPRKINIRASQPTVSDVGAVALAKVGFIIFEPPPRSGTLSSGARAIALKFATSSSGRPEAAESPVLASGGLAAELAIAAAEVP